MVVALKLYLRYLELRYTSIKGGVEGDESEVIKQNTFSSCPNIENIYIDSGNLLAKPINVDAFKQNPLLRYFWIRSNNRVTGTLPDFGTSNFCIERSPLSQNVFDYNGKCINQYDKYKGVEQMLPFAKGISAKSINFDKNGEELNTHIWTAEGMLIHAILL